MKTKKTWHRILWALLFLLLIGGGTFLAVNHSTSSAAAPATEPAKIRVGVIVSEFTATGPTWIGTKYGYDSTVRATKELIDPSIELIPVIESGSETDEALNAVLSKYFPGKKPVIAVDTAHLAGLDVIVAVRICNAPDDLLNAVEGRVKEGAGLLIRRCFGVVTPEFTPQVTALNGFVEGQHGLGRGKASGKVIAQHPLLGKLQTGRSIKLGPNGAYGQLAPGGVGLIELAEGDVAPIGANARQRDDFVFYPLYISQLGKGRIVGCSFTEPVPAELNAATGGKFTCRCVKWLAGRPLD
jgi:hypothetical protein